MGSIPAERKGEVTALLMAWNRGDENAPDALARVVYAELQRLARRLISKERDQDTLQTAALIHEIYFRLIDADLQWQSSSHFFAVAAQAMRRLLVDRARRRKSEKRSGLGMRVTLSQAVDASPDSQLDVLALNDALSELGRIDARSSQVVELRYFGGLTIEETANVLGVSTTTITTDWTFARLWLFRRLRPMTT